MYFVLSLLSNKYHFSQAAKKTREAEETVHVLPVNFQERCPRLPDEDFEILRDCPAEIRNLIRQAFELGDDYNDLYPAFEAYTQGRLPGMTWHSNF